MTFAGRERGSISSQRPGVVIFLEQSPPLWSVIDPNSVNMLQCKEEINLFWETLAVSVDSRSESKKQNVLLKYTNCILTSAVLAGCTV